MSSAYLVKYTGPRGVECPNAVVTFGPGHGEDVAELAPLVKAALLDPRCGPEWTPQAIHITSMTYLGPWFDGTVGTESKATPCPRCARAQQVARQCLEDDMRHIREAYAADD